MYGGEPALSEVTAGRPHRFQVDGLRLVFVPEDESLFRLDEAGWEGLGKLLEGWSPTRVRTHLGRLYGADQARSCLVELRAAGLARFQAPGTRPRSGGGGEDGRAYDGGGEGEGGWLPSGADRPRLRALCLNVAHDCDLTCRYCFAGRGAFGRRRSLMSRATARRAVDLLLAASGNVDACEIDFFGGEPLLNLDVVKFVVSYGRERGAETGKRLGFTITTNAVRLGPAEAGFIDEAMENVVLSLDGRPEVHDRMRPAADGSGSHGLVLDNVSRFVKRRGDRDYWVRGTYTAHNLDFAEDVAYLAERGFGNISLEPAVSGPVGNGGWGLGLEHVERAAAEYLRLARMIHQWNRSGRKVRFFHFIAEPEAAPCYAKRVRGCGAGREYMAVTPEGEVYPCHQFVSHGEFRAGRLDDVGEGFLSARSREVGRLWLGSREACHACWARYRCSGGCHANAYSATGDLLKPDPVGCAFLKARLEAALYLAALEAQAPPAEVAGVAGAAAPVGAAGAVGAAAPVGAQPGQ